MKEALNILQAAHVLYPAGEAPERHKKWQVAALGSAGCAGNDNCH